MHRNTTIILAAILLTGVSACSQPAPAPEATEKTATVETPAAAATWTPAMPAPGAYEATTSDGKPYSEVTLETDGSYASGPREAGIAKMTDGKLCFDPSGTVNPERCYTLTQPAADGSFTATDDSGVTITVKPAA